MKQRQTLQDLLIHAIKGVAMYAHRAHQLGASDPEIDAFNNSSHLLNPENVNFDPDRLVELIHEAVKTRDAAREHVRARQCDGRNSASLHRWPSCLDSGLFRWKAYSLKDSRPCCRLGSLLRAKRSRTCRNSFFTASKASRPMPLMRSHWAQEIRFRLQRFTNCSFPYQAGANRGPTADNRACRR